MGDACALALKDNEETLHDDVRLHMADPENAGKMQRFNDVGNGHGRIDIREAVVCHDVDTLQDQHRWPGLQAAGKVTATREIRGSGVPRPAFSALATGFVRSGSRRRCARTGQRQI